MLGLSVFLFLLVILFQEQVTTAMTLEDIIISLQRRGMLTLSQKDTIVQHLNNDDEILSLHVMHNNNHSFLSKEQEDFLQKYFEEEEISGRMTRDIRHYVSTILKIQRSPILSKRGTPGESVSSNYNQSTSGIVQFVGNYRSDHGVVGEGSTSFPYRGIWGFAIADEEYALLSDIYGLNIINVTKPNQPKLVRFIELEQITFVRDVDVYRDTTNTTYAYVAAQPANLHVINVTAILNNDEIDVSTVDRGRVNYGHTVTVDHGLLILNSGNYNPNPNAPGCQIFDLIADPWNPPLVGMYTKGDCHDSTLNRINVKRNGSNHNVERLILVSADGGVGKWRFVDVQRAIDDYQLWNPEFPFVYYESPQDVVLGETQLITSFPTSYSHSHILDEETLLLYAFEESNGYDVAIWNLTNAIDAPVLFKTLTYARDKSYHNAILHNGRIFKVANKKYLGLAYYSAGFRVWDITDADDILEVGHYDTFQSFDDANNPVVKPNDAFPPNTDIFTFFKDPIGAWNLYTDLPSGHLLVSDLRNGLYILKIVPHNDTDETDKNEASLFDNVCISGSTRIALSNGQSEQVQNLRIGDMVQVDSMSFEPIVMFGHFNTTAIARYHQLTLDDGTIFEMSEHHLIYSRGNHPPVPVSTLKVGQPLQCGRRIIDKTIINKKGAYAPWTPSGRLMIENQILISNYITLQDGKTNIFGWSYQFLAHAMTLPLRRSSFWRDRDVAWLYDWVQTYWLQQPAWIMTCIFFLVILPLALLLHGAEQVIVMTRLYEVCIIGIVLIVWFRYRKILDLQARITKSRE